MRWGTCGVNRPPQRAGSLIGGWGDNWRRSGFRIHPQGSRACSPPCPPPDLLTMCEFVNIWIICNAGGTPSSPPCLPRRRTAAGPPPGRRRATPGGRASPSGGLFAGGALGGGRAETKLPSFPTGAEHARKIIPSEPPGNWRIHKDRGSVGRRMPDLQNSPAGLRNASTRNSDRRS